MKRWEPGQETRWWYETKSKYERSSHKAGWLEYHSGPRSTCRECWLERFGQIYGPELAAKADAGGYVSYDRRGIPSYY